MDSTHCKAIFTVNHDGLSPVTGFFSKMYGGIRDFDGKKVEGAKVTAYIEVESISTGLFPRDFHLKSENFFDIKKYQRMEFTSTAVKSLAPGKFKLIGNLKIKDISKKVEWDCEGPTGPIKDEHNMLRIGFTAKTKLNRKDFGINWNREVAPSVFMVGDPVDVRLELEFVQPQTR